MQQLLNANIQSRASHTVVKGVSYPREAAVLPV